MNSNLEYLTDGLPFYAPLEAPLNAPGEVGTIDEIEKKLYLIPTTHGERFDPDFSPIPSPTSILPEIDRWTRAYVITAIEVLARRRSITQLARSTHRFTYNAIASQIGTLKELPKIRRIHRSEPIEGVVELTATFNIDKRVRALVARFEGVDRRWICTEFCLL